MVETSVARLLRDASQRKYYVVFIDVIFEYISSHPTLSANEKLLWLNIARKSMRDPTLAYRATHEQLASLIGVKPDTAYRVLRNLKAQGFLEASSSHPNQVRTYAVKLPAAALDLLELAPNRGETKAYEKLKNKTPLEPQVVSDQNPVCHGKKSDTIPDQNPILIINNNINNKHNDHNACEVISVLQENLPDAKSLLDTFERLQKEYANLSPLAKLRSINAHFTARQMEIIHGELLKRSEPINKSQTFKSEKTSQSPSQPKVTTLVKPPSPQKAPLISLMFEGENFLIEEQVKNLVFGEFTWLYESKKLPGVGENQSFRRLIHEVLYYITKAGALSIPSDQLHRYYVAKKICLGGNWREPNGMAKLRGLRNEQAWEHQKKQEMREARKQFVTQGG